MRGVMPDYIPTKAEYYREDPAMMSVDDKFLLHNLESREATGLLWKAALHVRDNHTAFRLLNRLRDELIEDEIQNGEKSTTAMHRTLFLYRMNTAGVASRFG